MLIIETAAVVDMFRKSLPVLIAFLCVMTVACIHNKQLIDIVTSLYALFLLSNKEKKDRRSAWTIKRRFPMK